jgi:hypothetical protein
MFLINLFPRSPLFSRALCFATIEMRGFCESWARVRRRDCRAKKTLKLSGLRRWCEGCEGFSCAHVKGCGVGVSNIQIFKNLYVYEKTLATIETLVNLLKYNIFLPASVCVEPSLNHRKGAK